jgi:hypothetical protein
MQEVLEETDRRKDQFLAMLAHELRNPAAPIRNAAGVLGPMNLQDEKQRLVVNTLQRQSAHLARLLDELLDVARITQGRIERRREPIEVRTCIEVAVESAAPLMSVNQQCLRVSQAPQALWVSADSLWLSQCLTNLLNNAAKFTASGGEIHLRTYAEGDDAVIDIQDTGIGISADLLPRIFDLFVQNGRPLDRSQGGLGIGLSICKQLIELHGGHIAAVSPGIGLGSIFTVRLPLARDNSSAEVATPLTVGNSKRVLVVDDNRDAADSIATLLELAGHEVLAVYAAEDALEQAHRFGPDIILLDIGLPRINGYEVARRPLSKCVWSRSRSPPSVQTGLPTSRRCRTLSHINHLFRARSSKAFALFDASPVLPGRCGDCWQRRERASF